ncbi:hypothetical protein A7985_07275 [Pseudoalteromonas luteoviolacea]|uniref:Heparan-alpha-glucosaminide N-acetyltransferase catalytic domain-containing protein n=1 Tax=Pseudoalteromonas luteoviolacea TaxID=43657 RepID=A0A1C0TWX1_9GAMM|nr:heparan-alpha-glucosaminide N-acetyltransferase domain-containing protein [Pseudoalteromonas luteoviolacea]OCQ23734.1 hypothetical protein A7985_07275 [Pseudoalteromonas luteoviolacea]
MNETTIKKRIDSIDMLRGLVILIMLVDHAREKFYLHKNVADPMNIDSTDPDLFFTRLLAHFCAPIFVFLTGLSAWLYAHPANKAPRSAQSFLLKRGLFLILIEITLVNFSWFAAYTTLYLQVIWAIGVSMIALAALLYLPRLWIAVIGLAIVFGHNALGFIEFAPHETGYSLWTILHDRAFLVSEGALKIRASYPVLPWIGVIAVGYAAGPLFSHNVDELTRRKTLIMGGTACLVALVLLRAFNIYGESQPWQMYDESIRSVMSFLNFTKYPPSLMFLLFTLGIGAFVLAYLETAKSKLCAMLKTFGSVPMFFYILHLYVLLITYFILSKVIGTTTVIGPNDYPYLGFPNVWLVWLAAIVLAALLYWPCKKFSQFKHSSQSAWVKYF